jgi:hypothetical protein
MSRTVTLERKTNMVKRFAKTAAISRETNKAYCVSAGDEYKLIHAEASRRPFAVQYPVNRAAELPWAIAPEEVGLNPRTEFVNWPCKKELASGPSTRIKPQPGKWQMVGGFMVWIGS